MPSQVAEYIETLTDSIKALLDGLSSEQKQLQEQALKFASNELAPYMKNWDRNV